MSSGEFVRSSGTPEPTVVHEAPAWRDLADTVLRVRVPNAPDGKDWFEQVWARRLGGSRFELCCIPLAAYGLALGDIVEAAEEGASAHTVAGVVRASGHAVLRVWLGDARRETWDEVHRLIDGHRLLSEFRQPALVAIDIPDTETRTTLEGELRQLERAGSLHYEVGSDPYTEPAGQ